MDGTLAVIFIVASLTDIALKDCPDSCLSRSDAPARLTLQAGNVIFQENAIDAELYVGYDQARRFGPFQPTLGASASEEGGAWFGGGLKWTSEWSVQSPAYFEASLMQGFHLRGDGPDLGGALQFRSAIGIGYRFPNGDSLSLHYDHRSNADTQTPNPGLETLALRYAIEIR